MRCLLQCPWGLFLRASTSSLRKIPKQVLSEKPLYIIPELSQTLMNAVALTGHSKHIPLNLGCNHYDPWQWNGNTSKYQTISPTD
jgi:hypothetical protein